MYIRSSSSKSNSSHIRKLCKQMSAFTTAIDVVSLKSSLPCKICHLVTHKPKVSSMEFLALDNLEFNIEAMYYRK